MRHMKDVSLFENPIALMFLKSLEEERSVRQLHLAKTADASLIIAGLFPERARRARVSPKYFLSMSQMAYMTLYDVCEAMKKYHDAKQYSLIAENTEKIAIVLTFGRKSFV